MSYCLPIQTAYHKTTMKEKWSIGLPILLMVVFALTRLPGLMPPNFSAVYGLAFCAGVYFPGRLAWWLPITTLAVTDLGLNLYYFYALGFDSFQAYQLINYAVYAVVIGLGRCFSARSSWLTLLGGGLLGAILFYLITNTASWFFNPFNNPEYTKSLAGWQLALSKGTGGWPQTWEFFRNTLLSGGLFTGLFVGAMKLSEAADTASDPKEESNAEPNDTAPDDSKPAPSDADNSAPGNSLHPAR
jgi:hypothetical protein